MHSDFRPIMQTTSSTAKPPLNNCKELIRGKLQAKWEIQGDHLIVELFGRIREDEYMAFGLSGHPGRSQMVMFYIRIFFSCSSNLFILFRLIERFSPTLWLPITTEFQKCLEPTIITFRIWPSVMVLKASVPMNG